MYVSQSDHSCAPKQKVGWTARRVDSGRQDFKICPELTLLLAMGDAALSSPDFHMSRDEQG